MKAAVLCNGPSKVSFDPHKSLQYKYIMGCNIPWYIDCSATVILDTPVMEYWFQNKLPQMPIWFSRNCWRETPEKARQYFREHDFFKGLLDPLPEYDSSGHVAASKVIQLGYTEIDIYGCDSYFTGVMESYTHQFHDGSPEDKTKQRKGWLKRWETIIKNNPDVTLNFIK